jgi:hypothetical protein
MINLNNIFKNNKVKVFNKEKYRFIEKRKIQMKTKNNFNFSQEIFNKKKLQFFLQ